MKLFSVPAAIVAVIVSSVMTILVSFILGGHVSLYVSPPYNFEDIPDLTGNVAIVTGSNTGIGYVTARELAKKGAKVFLAARSEMKGIDAVNRIKAELRDLPGANLIEFIQLDLASLAEVRKFAKEFSSRQLKLDMLILNAGVMATPFGLTVDGIETQIGTNHMGHFLLVNLLTPVIKESKSRIVHVSSIMHESSHPEGIKISSFYEEAGYIPFLAYGQSKLANVLFSNELARRFNGTGVTSNSVHPGAVSTDLRRHFSSSMNANVIFRFAYALLEKFLGIIDLDADGGALTQLYVATSPHLESVTGEYFVPIALKRPASAHARNETLAALLWEESVRFTKPFW